MPEIAKWLISFLTTICAAYFGYLMTVKKFKKEQLWQEKYKIYQEILSALEAILLWANETYCHHKMIPTIGIKTLDKDIIISFAEARRILAKVSCIGKLIISNEVIQELDALQSELWNEDFRAEEDHYYPGTPEESEYISEHVEHIRKIIEPKLEKIITYAKSDLA